MNDRHDEAVAARLRRVDNRRMDLLRADHGPRTRPEVLTHATDLLLDRPHRDHAR